MISAWEKEWECEWQKKDVRVKDCANKRKRDLTLTLKEREHDGKWEKKTFKIREKKKKRPNGERMGITNNFQHFFFFF